eukprot:m.102565 g.102565  ORF g.102565 m.102565 type:complete len:992 (-) comp22348_c0_seq1:81-3056(-)
MLLLVLFVLVGLTSGKVTLHLVPHSHDDTGWKKTVDEYFTGANDQWLQPGGILLAAVSNTYDTVVNELSQDPTRTFTAVEMAFFTRWWRGASESQKELAQKLVQNGQLQFANGGWCMHDEAVVHYIDAVDQTTLGHSFIKATFNVTPDVGWQVDPFGHSSTQASLLTARAGFNAFYFGRIDYQDKAYRIKHKALQTVWRASPSLPDTDVMAQEFHISYAAPNNYNFDFNRLCLEQGNCGIPWVDDPELETYNIPESVKDFETLVLSWAAQVRSNQVIMPMGSDFAYADAHNWYKNMDKIIKYVNAAGNINVRYSTPSDYTKALHDTNVSLPIKTDDYMPYASAPHEYWSGYFTSRAALKGYIRYSSALFTAARQLDFLSRFVHKAPSSEGNLVDLAEGMGLTQHHDAVTGTERQRVANDYSRRLTKGVNNAFLNMSSSFNALTSASSPSNYSFCPLANISVCAATRDVGDGGVVLTAFNPLARNLSTVLKVPIQNKDVKVLASDGTTVVVSQVVDAPIQPPLAVPPGHTANPYVLMIPAQLPSVGFVTFFLMFGGTSNGAAVYTPPVVSRVGGSQTISSGALSLTFSDGQLSAMDNLQDKVSASVDQIIGFYPASNRSGAYIFGPATETPTIFTTSSFSVVTDGPLVQEAHQKFTNDGEEWVTQVTRVFKGQSFAEVELTVGSIPIEDNVGKEVITRYTSSLNSASFFTDSNGREMIERKINYRESWPFEVNEPVAGNYAPFTTQMHIQDNTRQLSVITDRSHGGTSLNQSLEFMVHRRLLFDDHKGVSEALNETQCGCVNCSCGGLIVRSKHFLTLDATQNGMRASRSLVEAMYSQPILAFASLPNNDAKAFAASHITHSSLIPSLPENVKLLTLEALPVDHWAVVSPTSPAFLLRLAHLFAVGEDQILSQPVNVTINDLFPSLENIQVQEVSLSANQPFAQMQRARFHFNTDAGKAHQKAVLAAALHQEGNKFVAQLQPMDVRTFIVFF